MAPTAPSKRRSLRAKLAARSGPEPYAPRRAPRPDAVGTSDAFINSKKDKRTIKHAAFVSRIEKTTNPNTSARSGSKVLKRGRRPGGKLVADLGSLADALPDLLAGGETEEGLRQMREGKVRHRSLRSRPGALKRRERVVRGEVRRFGVSLARLSAVAERERERGGEMEVGRSVEGEGQGGGQEGEKEQGEEQAPAPVPMSTANRWAALRGFISATMEQNPAFVVRGDGK